MRSAAAPWPSSGPRTRNEGSSAAVRLRRLAVHGRPQVTSRRSEMKTAATLTMAM